MTGNEFWWMCIGMGIGTIISGCAQGIGLWIKKKRDNNLRKADG
jgi:hypothetical protein